MLAEEGATAAVTVVARGRLPSDVVDEVMDILADDPGLVVCDLTGIAAAESTVVATLSAVTDYLTEWPGSAVVVHTEARVRIAVRDYGGGAPSLRAMDRSQSAVPDGRGLLLVGASALPGRGLPAGPIGLAV